MARNLDTDALNQVIQACSTYIDTLQTAKQTFAEAMEDCCAVMGNDEIFRRNKPAMEEAQEDLVHAIGYAASVRSALQQKWKEIIQQVDRQ